MVGCRLHICVRRQREEGRGGGGGGGGGAGGGGTKEAPIYTYTDIQPALLINPHVETIWLV